MMYGGALGVIFELRWIVKKRRVFLTQKMTHDFVTGLSQYERAIQFNQIHAPLLRGLHCSCWGRRIGKSLRDQFWHTNDTRFRDISIPIWEQFNPIKFTRRFYRGLKDSRSSNQYEINSRVTWLTIWHKKWHAILWHFAPNMRSRHMISGGKRGHTSRR